MKRLSVYKTNPNIVLPRFATKQSACFDLSFQAEGKALYHGYNMNNAPFSRPMSTGEIRIMPGDRVLVPTGLIFDIPQHYSVRIYPRSGLSTKKGLNLINCVGIIDSDYVEEIFIPIYNNSQQKIRIYNGDRIAQAEMVFNGRTTINYTKIKPNQKGNREGGFGSTGLSWNQS